MYVGMYFKDTSVDYKSRYRKLHQTVGAKVRNFEANAHPGLYDVNGGPFASTSRTTGLLDSIAMNRGRFQLHGITPPPGKLGHSLPSAYKLTSLETAAQSVFGRHPAPIVSHCKSN